MLPTTVFERLSKARAVRVPEDEDERRLASRLPQDAVVGVHLLDEGIVCPAYETRLLDFSPSGVRVMVPEDLGVKGEFLVVVGGVNETTETSAVLLCKARQIRNTGAGEVEIGARIQAMMSPKQTLEFGAEVARYKWIACAVVMPEDPFGKWAQAA